jgi:hypothetical protein
MLISIAKSCLIPFFLEKRLNRALLFYERNTEQYNFFLQNISMKIMTCVCCNKALGGAQEGQIYGLFGLQPSVPYQKIGVPIKFGLCLDWRPQIGSPKCAHARLCYFCPREGELRARKSLANILVASLPAPPCGSHVISASISAHRSAFWFFLKKTSVLLITSKKPAFQYYSLPRNWQVSQLLRTALVAHGFLDQDFFLDFILRKTIH